MVEGDRRLVICPGYQESEFGYFVAWEAEETIQEQLMWCYYPFAFFLRETDKTYQKVLDWTRDYIDERDDTSQS